MQANKMRCRIVAKTAEGKTVAEGYGEVLIAVEKSELKGVDYGQPATIEFTSVDSDWRVNGVFPLVTCCVIDPGWKLEL